MNEIKTVEQFKLNFWDKSFDEILPLMSTFARSMDFDHQRGIFRRCGEFPQYSSFECMPAEASQPLQSMDEILPNSGDQVDVFTIRIMELENTSGLCLVESSIPLNTLFFEFDIISKLCGALRYNFSYHEFSDGPFSIGFEVHEATSRIRFIFAHGDEENPKQGRWTFNQFGAPLPWENAENYKKRSPRDRLTRNQLIDYMSALGVHYPTYAKRQFSRVVEFRRSKDGASLSRFDDSARGMAVEVERHMTAVAAENGWEF